MNGRVCVCGGGQETVLPSELSILEKIKSLLEHTPSTHHHDGKWALRNSSLPLIWGPMLMKLVINSLLCCRFRYCMCNQMRSSLGFTAINELPGVRTRRQAFRTGLGSGLAWARALGGRGQPRRCLYSFEPRRPHEPPAARSLLSSSRGPPRTLQSEETRWLSRSQESRLSGNPGWGEGEYRPFVFPHPAPTVLKHLATAHPPRPLIWGWGGRQMPQAVWPARRSLGALR